MGKCYPFSEIDLYFKELGEQKVICLADTNFLIAMSDTEHTFHEDVQFFAEKLATLSLPEKILPFVA